MKSRETTPSDEYKKTVIWIGSSRDDLKSLPVGVQRDLGHSLRDVQKGRNPGNIKPLAYVGLGVWEIVVDDAAGTFRLVYSLLKDCIAVLHVFQKKSKSGIKTPKKDMELVRERMKRAMIICQKWRESL